MIKTLREVIHGRTIVLGEDLGVADGQEVEVQVKVIPMAAGTEKASSLARSVARIQRELKCLAERVRQLEKAALPPLPPADADGYYPALPTLDAVVARQVITRRRKACWSQAELARRADVRQETPCRLETGKHAPNLATVDKIDRALRAAGV